MRPAPKDNGLWRTGIQHIVNPRGYVRWTLTDDKTKKVIKGGRANVITNYARQQLADAFIGTAVTFPQFVAVGTGTTTPAAADTALETLSQYDGANDAKQADSRSVRGLYTSRIVTQFITSEANITIRELGLYDAANGGNLWARVAINVTKSNTQRFTVYWYITFERTTGVAIKSGGSIGATGTVTAATESTLTFASAVTIVMIHNNAGEDLYFRLNQALSGESPPVTYDFVLADGERLFLNNEEISISTVSVYGATINGSMPLNTLAVVGW